MLTTQYFFIPLLKNCHNWYSECLYNRKVPYCILVTMTKVKVKKVVLDKCLFNIWNFYRLIVTKFITVVVPRKKIMAIICHPEYSIFLKHFLLSKKSKQSKLSFFRNITIWFLNICVRFPNPNYEKPLLIR